MDSKPPGPRVRVIQLLIYSSKLCFFIFYPQYFNNRWLANNTFNLHKGKEDKKRWMCFYFSQWFAINGKRRGKCWLQFSPYLQLCLFQLWFIFVCQSNDKLSTWCLFPICGLSCLLCQGAVCMRVRYFLFQNKLCCLKHFAEWPILGLKGPYRTFSTSCSKL